MITKRPERAALKLKKGKNIMACVPFDLYEELLKIFEEVEKEAEREE